MIDVVTFGCRLNVYELDVCRQAAAGALTMRRWSTPAP